MNCLTLTIYIIIRRAQKLLVQHWEMFFCFHPSRSQASDPTLGNDFYSHPSLLEASGSTLANKMSPCITNIEFEIAHINLNQTSHCLKVGNQGLSQPDKEKILELF